MSHTKHKPTMTLPKVFIRDRIYVPTHSIVDIDRLKQHYTKHLFKDVACATCEYKPERPCSVCESCANYQGVTKLWVPRNIQGDHYIGVPVGDKRNVERKAGILFDEHKIIDARKFVPFDYKIKFLATLRSHQVKLVEDFMRKKYGLLEAPPRTGKTLLMLYIGLQLGQRMVLLANQHEFLQQFIWHIEGNEAEGIPKCTNLPEIQQRVGKKLYGFPRSAEDFETMQLMVLTYQQFMSETKGDARMKRLSKYVGTVVVDEAHKIGASTFSAVLNKFHTRYRFGVTGTVVRKDCFVAGSQIKTVSGNTSIEKLVVGDSVQSFNHKTNKVEEKKVVQTHLRKASYTVKLIHSGGSLICTPDEEFFCVNRNAYVKACELTSDDTLQIL